MFLSSVVLSNSWDRKSSVAQNFKYIDVKTCGYTWARINAWISRASKCQRQHESCARNWSENVHEDCLSANTDFHLFQVFHLKFLFSEINALKSFTLLQFLGGFITPLSAIIIPNLLWNKVLNAKSSRDAGCSGLPFKSTLVCTYWS